MQYQYLAIDLGAESGRVILGTLSDEFFELKEIHRFPNGMLNILGKYHWNITQLYAEIIKGLEISVREEKALPCAIGIDTWGVDYGLIDGDGNLLGLPFAYRDDRTNNAIEEFTKIVPRERIYDLTGTLFAQYNTLFQLFAATKIQTSVVGVTKTLLFIPDLLTYFLTGMKVTELSFASTSQLFNPIKMCWEPELFNALGIDKDIMPQVVKPGTVVGNLKENVCTLTGLNNIPVVAVASHDTNSAIAAIPAQGSNWAFISSGTWSLMGFESTKPVISKLAYSLNFTNEMGVENTFNILKNLMGLWLLQQCKKKWASYQYSYQQLVQMATQTTPFAVFIDIDDDAFLNPIDMPMAIEGYLKITGQKNDLSHGEIVRAILEGLAFKYRKTYDEITALKGERAEVLFITGGGIHNQLLCQFTSNACNVTVKTGIGEGSATGNILTQALGLGHLTSLSHIRRVVANSCQIENYNPVDVNLWENAYQKYLVTINKSNYEQ